MLHHVSSSMITTVQYDETKEVLEITDQSDHIYAYFNVPFEIYEQLIQADSKGRYMHENIIDAYDYANISDKTTDF